VANKSRAYVVGGEGTAGSQRTWDGFSKAEGFVDMPPGNGQIIPIPIPAGVNVVFGIKMLVLGVSQENIQGCLQEVFYAPLRDGAGALNTSTSDTNATQRQGSGDNLPKLAGSQVNGNNLECLFDNPSNVTARVHYSWTMSPPLSPPPAPPPVP